ncbi:M1 family aminopeptidase [Pontibacter sp. MBLB2868]|uniref:M1 family aminopeptidase n=1 Tax=Pontibacter sp. MBLB2868 TaxID=3451555 RepID=UPI003F74CBD3
MRYLNQTCTLFKVFAFFILFAILHFSAHAQEISSCAVSRISATQRQAVASPEHQRLMNLYDMTFYKLDLHLERNSTYIEGNVRLSAKIKASNFNTFAFELHPNFQIDSVLINGQRAHNINRKGSDVTVNLSTSLNANATITTIIYYKGTAPNDNAAAIGNGFNTAQEWKWGPHVTWSLSEPYAAYEWWPTKQVLTDKADSVHVFVTTSAENKVGSNGSLTRVVNLPGNKKRYEWKSRYPIDYYLVSVAVSDYDEYLQSANPSGAPSPVPILNYVYSGGALSYFKEEMDRTPGFIEHFSELFGLYPFYKEKYGHSMAPMGGGMEHQTMTTQATFTFTLTAHELAHQWFGDNVTCASWQDIWLNEGFASYAEYLASERFEPDFSRQWIHDAHDLALQRPNGSVKVPDTLNVNRIFDYRLTYKKGASVVHMLRFEINDDKLFFKVLQNYQQQYGGATATTADLKQVAEQTTGKNLGYFFDQWYSGEGFPVFQLQWNQEDDRLLLATKQQGSGSTTFFKTDMEYKVITTAGDTTIRVTHSRPNQNFVVNVTGTVTGIEVDPQDWALEQVISNEQNTALKVPALETPALYPNPVANGSINVSDLNFTPTTAFIYNTAGQKVWQQQLDTTPNVSISISSLPAGVYHLLLSNGTNNYRGNFVKVQ